MDSLSRDFHKSDQTLTNIFHQILPQQTAALFHIKQLPRNVISWISLLAAASTLKTAFPKPLQSISLATGKGGEYSSNTQESQEIPGRNPTSIENNPGVIIRHLSATKPVQKNGETCTPPRNCQVRHIGCICVILDAPSEQPDPRLLRSNILNHAATTQGLQNNRPTNKTPKSYTRKTYPSRLQTDGYTPKHSHRSTDHRCIFLRHAVMRVLH